MNGTLIDPLAASHTAGQSYRQKLYAVRGGRWPARRCPEWPRP